MAGAGGRTLPLGARQLENPPGGRACGPGGTARWSKCEPVPPLRTPQSQDPSVPGLGPQPPRSHEALSPPPSSLSPSRPPQPDSVSCRKQAGTGGYTRPAGRHSWMAPYADPAQPRLGPGARTTVSGYRSAGLSPPCAELNLESGTWLLPPQSVALDQPLYLPFFLSPPPLFIL